MIKDLIEIPIYHKERIGLKEFKTLQNYAVDHLGVKNIYTLRDKFEGERYYKQFLQRSFAEISVQRFIEGDFFRLEEKSQKGFKPEFIVNNKKIEVVDCSFEDLPKIPVGDYDRLIFCFVNLDSREVWIVGSLEKEVALKVANKNLVSPMFRNTYYGVLDNLKILETIGY